MVPRRINLLKDDAWFLFPPCAFFGFPLFVFSSVVAELIVYCLAFSFVQWFQTSGTALLSWRSEHGRIPNQAEPPRVSPSGIIGVMRRTDDQEWPQSKQLLRSVHTRTWVGKSTPFSYFMSPRVQLLTGDVTRRMLQKDVVWDIKTRVIAFSFDSSCDQVRVMLSTPTRDVNIWCFFPHVLEDPSGCTGTACHHRDREKGKIGILKQNRHGSPSTASAPKAAHG